MMIRKGHFRPGELDACFAEEKQALSAAAREASPRDLGATLGIASSKLESTFGALCSLLTDNGKPADWLVARVARAEDWSGLAYFAMQTGRLWESLAADLDEQVCAELGPRLADAYLRGSFSAAVLKALRALADFWPKSAEVAEACLDEVAPDSWAEAAVGASVDDLYRASVFLHDRVAGHGFNEAVQDPAFVTHLLERDLSTSPGRLAHARRRLAAISPEAASAVEELLAAPDSGRQWARAAFRRSLHLLPEALRSADLRELRSGAIAYLLEIEAGELSKLLLNTSPTVVSDVARPGDRLGERLLEVLQGEARARFTKLLLDSSAQQAGRFLGRSAATELIAREINGDEWAESRPMLTLGRHPASFAPIANGLARGGRGDLAHATAVAFGEMMIAAEIPIRQLHLATLSHLLRLTRDEPGEWRERVVDAVWSDGWLRDRFAGDRISELGRALFSIWHYYPPLARRVPLDLLTKRTVESLRAARTVGWLYSALELIGAASLYGMPATAIAGQRPISRKAIDPMFRGLADLSGPMTALEAQLWLGFIALAEANDLELPLDNADGILERLSKQTVVTDRHAETVARIEAWLGQRIAAGSTAAVEAL
jgi:hypothetical protein